MAKKKSKKNQLAHERINKPICENCGTSNGYPRLKSNEWVCRTCGQITSLKKLEIKK